MHPPEAVASKLQSLPTQPGVYQYYDARGKLLYVGKAKNLRHRVKSYFQTNTSHSPRIAMMVSQIADLKLMITHTELEALVLEANLIKTYRPKYNILMKDDKKYPWLMLTNEPFPRLVTTRDPRKNTRCFGPYVSPGAMYQTVKLIKKIFPLRQRRIPLFKDRPCMNYFIGSCMGPCQNKISADDYDQIVRQVELFLKGQASELLTDLQQQMQQASEQMQFELAAKIRDRYQAVVTTLEQQRVMVGDTSVNLDVLGVALAGPSAYGAVLVIRQGKLIQTYYADLATASDHAETDIVQAFIEQYYQTRLHADDMPHEIVIPVDLPDAELLSQWLSQQSQRKVKLTHPKRAGYKRDFIELAQKNAAESKERAQLEQQQQVRSDPAQALVLLQQQLKLPVIPRRMECYDISHVQGTHTVASMVVFTDGVPDKKAYRRFNITTTQEGTPDDFQSMREVMTRRFSKQTEPGWAAPDLVIIDGGKGQLSSADGAVKALGITDQPMISLAKKFEEVFLPGQSRPIVLPRDSMALYLLQQIRDEAHRFAITSHRNKRGKAQTTSWLDSIAGIGPKRKQQLLQAFDSIEAMQQASPEAMAKATGWSNKQAARIVTLLSSNKD